MNAYSSLVERHKRFADVFDRGNRCITLWSNEIPRKPYGLKSQLKCTSVHIIWAVAWPLPPALSGEASESPGLSLISNRDVFASLSRRRQI